MNTPATKIPATKIHAVRGGFTLIEVILAIGLSGALLALLTWGIGLYVIRLESSRNAVEQSQLARSVLRMVADDLRNAATVYEQDTSFAITLAASQASFDVEEMDQIEPDDEIEEAETRRPVGLFGQPGMVQLDVLKSRPMDPAITYGGDDVQLAATPLRGVTTVRYFVSDAGLCRQEAVRDVELWEATSGSSASLEASTRVVAPEVVEMRVLFSDGEQSLEAWDTEEQEGALPIAVEVQLTFREGPAGSPEGDYAEPPAAEGYRVYRVVVALPTTNPAVETGTDEEAAL
ncbi:MAG: prepilin-type N-terminal cleavage/methylation domain-containing protein [Planctomycetota bacterium]